MGKAGKWLRNFLTGKRDDKEKAETSSPLPLTDIQPVMNPLPIPKEKKRWSFRRSVGAGKSMNFSDLAASAPPPTHGFSDEFDQKRHAMAMAVATAAAADAAVAAAQAAAAVMRLTPAATSKPVNAIEKGAAIKIQAAFKAYLARKALCALRGIVKLQALVRGHLVRKQTAETLRSMQALFTAQARVQAQRIRMVEESQINMQRLSTYRRSPQHPRSIQLHEMDKSMEENIKIVEMDQGGSKGSTKNRQSNTMQADTRDARFSEYYGHRRVPSRSEPYQMLSPAPSALTEMSPRVYSGYFEDFSFATAQSSPYLSAVSVTDPTQSSLDYPFFPNYMANTESSRAKTRSQSAPRQRTDAYERQSSRRKQSVEGRNIPKSVKMQRSSSHVGLTANGYQFPWSIKLDKSSISLQESECGSTSTVLTNTNYCRSLVGFEANRKKY